MSQISIQDSTSPEVFSGDYLEVLESVDLKRILNILQKINLAPNSDVCDIGCGTGILAEFLYSKVRKYVGLDFNLEMIEYARKKCTAKNIQNVEFVQTDGVSFCLKNKNAFEAVFTFAFSGYLTDDSFVEHFSAFRESLKKDGHLFLYISNRDFFFERLKRMGLVKKTAAPYPFPRNAEESWALLERSGFKKIIVHHISHYNILRIFHPLNNLPFIGKFFRAQMFIVATK
jgi:SAM-dependent methyltransferase